jgi:phosphoglycerate dehydrogenase-like enzyme
MIMHAIDRPNILILPRPSLYRQLFSPESDSDLRRLGDVRFNDREQDLSSEDLAEMIPGHDIVITGWRSPRFTDPVFDAADRLKLIAHSAGSIRFMLDETHLDRGVRVTAVAAAMAPAVAEMALLMIMLLLRPVHRHDAALKTGQDWRHVKAAGMGEELAGQRIGVIGAGHTGRTFIRLMIALGAEIDVHDPYLSETDAAGLGARKVRALDDLLRTCRIVSLQAPVTSETRGMIGRRELALLQDGAIFINTARAALVDSEALLAELQSGRISAGLDVFDQEPLPVDSAFRRLSNAIITPHLGAATYEGYRRQGRYTVNEVRRFCAGEPLKHEVTPQMLATMA